MELLKRCYYDVALSATPFTLPALMDFAGSDRILFGSDFPFVPEPMLKMFDSYLATYALQQRDVFPRLERETAMGLLPRRALG